MKVKELIDLLKKCPQEEEIFTSNSDGCDICNGDGLSWYHNVYEVAHRDEGEYPYRKSKNIVVIS